MSRVGSNFFYICLLFFPLSIGRAGASQTRRLILLISVGWLPPDVSPSAACLMLGTRVAFGLFTLPRVTPSRGCASSDRRWKPRKLLRQPTVIFRLSAVRQPAWHWPTCRHFSPGQEPHRPDWHVGPWPSTGDTVCRDGLELSNGSPGSILLSTPSSPAITSAATAR